MHVSSRQRLGPQHAASFDGATLFFRFARVVCAADCLPNKELYEAWEMARRVRRKLRGGRVVDWACGHGLLAHVMLLIDDTSSSALAYDVKLPSSAHTLHDALQAVWPRLSAVTLLQSRTPPALEPGDVVVSCHACGGLTDDVITAAIAVGARVAVLPCCQSRNKNDDGGLTGWLDPALAIDVTRAATLRAAGYQVWTQSIPADITPKNRLLVARPTAAP